MTFDEHKTKKKITSTYIKFFTTIFDTSNVNTGANLSFETPMIRHKHSEASWST